MKKQDLPLIIAIITIIIVLLVSIYTLSIADRAISQNALIIIQIVFTIFTILAIIIMAKIYNIKNIRPEKVLLIIMPIFCILLSVAIPFGRGHDEIMHWYKAFEISEGQLTTPINKESKISVSTLPDGVQNTIVERSKAVFKYVDNISLLSEKMKYNEKIIVTNQNSTAYCFVQYIPEVIGILIGKLITQTPILIAYFQGLLIWFFVF